MFLVKCVAPSNVYPYNVFQFSIFDLNVIWISQWGGGEEKLPLEGATVNSGPNTDVTITKRRPYLTMAPPLSH